MLNIFKNFILKKYADKRINQSISKLEKKPSYPLRLNIGAGNFLNREWHIVDYVTDGYNSIYSKFDEKIDVPYDIAACKKLMINDNSIEAVYTSHTIEHFKENQVQSLFDNCYRVLKKDGIFRVICPDADLYIQAFLRNDTSFFTYRHGNYYVENKIQNSIKDLFLENFIPLDLSKKISSEQIILDIKKQGVYETLNKYCEQTKYFYDKSNFHISWYNYKKIKLMLEKSGFNIIYKSGYGQSVYPKLRNKTFFDNSGPSISVYVEAQKN